MTFPTFALERNQSLFENAVEINLTESGVEPMTLAELLTPEEQAELMAIRLGYNYTEGTPQVRRAIASWYSGAGIEQVLVTAGAAEANFITYWTMMRPGDAMAVMLPNFMQFHGLAAAFGHEVRPFHLVQTKESWGLDIDALERATADGRVRLIAICNPNNPTGAVLTRTEVEAIVRAAERSGAWIVCDEIYRGSELDGRPATLSLHGLHDRVIVTCSTSKSLAHAGLRIGWIVAPAPIIKEVAQRQDYTTIGTGPLNQYLAARLLAPAGRARMLERSRRLIARNLAVIDEWVGAWGGRLAWLRPQAGGMAFVRYDFPIGSSDLSRRLREEENVFVVAGDWFGMDGHLRIGTGGEAEKLREGLRRIDRVLRSLVKA